LAQDQRISIPPNRLDRAQKCERLRGHIPNLVAVDFYGVGDLMRVVDKLNGVSPSSHGG
jgi:hypothetical protein